MVFEIHHVEGFDWDMRMFNRDLTVGVDENGYSGRFSYEGMKFKTETYPTVREVLEDAVRRLHRKKFTELRSRINKREDRYLAEREDWIYYEKTA